ncbi:MAG: hypothetical protein J7L21_07345 [Sulfurimonas sp.]|nr:hypothetical protein [Sulfurimonas sp.]
MREHKQTVLINGKESEIFYRKSRANNEAPKVFTEDVLKVINELLIFKDSSLKYPKGITTLNTITSWDEPRIGIKRLSNKIIEIRKIIPESALLTFKALSESEWKYGVIKEPKHIKFLEDLREQILKQISKQKK